MRQKEIERKFEEIVEFAEIGKFLDTPVKHYSSGMYTRLAFSVAAHLEPEILLVDEVLAVGDAGFQKKCLGKMNDVAKQGRTVLFVSHNISAIKKICPRSFLMGEGQLIQDGDSSLVTRAYIAATNQKLEQFDASRRQGSSDSVKIINAYFVREDGSVTDTFLFSDSVTLMIQVDVLQPTKFCVELILRQAEGVPVAFAPSGLAYDWEVEGTSGPLTVKAQLPPLRFAAGMYSIDIILGESGVRFHDYIESAISFFIDHTAIGKMNWRFSQSRGQGYCLWDVGYGLPNEDEPM